LNFIVGGKNSASKFSLSETGKKICDRVKFIIDASSSAGGDIKSSRFPPRSQTRRRWQILTTSHLANRAFALRLSTCIVAHLPDMSGKGDQRLDQEEKIISGPRKPAASMLRTTGIEHVTLPGLAANWLPHRKAISTSSFVFINRAKKFSPASISFRRSARSISIL
jgi:hypothetical protein